MSCLVKKLYVKWENISVTKVPNYKGLQVSEIVRFAASNFRINDYLPEYQYDKEPNREWLCNVVNSLIPEEFKAYIQVKVDQRKQDLIESQNLGIKVKPEFENLFIKSKTVSTMMGKSHFLTRNPRQNKSMQIIENLEEEKRNNDSKADSLYKEINELQSKIKEFENLQRESDQNAEKLNELYKLGIIDEEGFVVNNRMD